MRIPFSEPFQVGTEQSYLQEVLSSGHWHGDGPFTSKCNAWLTETTGTHRAIQTPSCTHALELASMLLDLGPGDEAVVPSFTFTSTAAAVAIRGATPVFVDITDDTLNLDPDALSAALTERTKAIFVLHYAGVAADMARIMQIADQHGVPVVEDNAHGIGAYFEGRHLGTYGALGTQSWHGTKNISCGEGGALLVNDEQYAERAEIIREKGTNRSQFLRGQVDKYTWVDQGSSYLGSDLTSAVLWAQMEAFAEIQRRRLGVWHRYNTELAGWAAEQGVRTMVVPDGCEQPAHMFYMIMPSQADQGGLIGHLRERDIVATFHYLPLDLSPAGQRFGRAPVPCERTADLALRLVRLPLYTGMTETDVTRVIDTVASYRTVSG